MSRPFTFGRNWQRFLRRYNPKRLNIAKQALLGFLGLKSLEGLSFLDIGSGSGLHAAAAFSAGAERIVTIDVDPDSVAATRQMREKMGAPSLWETYEASVLDENFMAGLGTFDIVYSWGVLHHTGDQWRALRHAMERMHETSRLYIALYAKEPQEPNWQYWINVKRAYNKAGWLKRRKMEWAYIWSSQLCHEWRLIPREIVKVLHYRFDRGMDYMTDIRDWLGGWPTVFSAVPEVVRFAARERGLVLVKLATGESCTEYLFVPKDAVEPMGYTAVDLRAHPWGIQKIEHADFDLEPTPVWLFGAAQAASQLRARIEAWGGKVAGFIDITPEAALKEGLPVLAFDDFAAHKPKNTPVVLASRYRNENIARLRSSGFDVIFDGFTYITN